MSIIYQLKAHQKHSHLKFAYVDGHHHCDFAAHKHDFSELFLVVSGSGKHTVAEYEYPLHKGDVFVINGDIEHGFRDVNKLKIINLMFDSNTPFFEIPSMRQLSGYQAMFKVEPIARQTTEYKAKLTLDRQQLPEIERLLSDLKSEYEASQPGFEVMLTSLMQQLVIALSRMYQDQSQELPQTTLALSRALVFIEQHFSDVGVNSDAIAKAAFISKRQLERLFRQFLDTSPNQYLRDVQLNYATKLLCEENERSVQHIAEQCGFSDSNYFSKCFKQKFQHSPRSYRKEHFLQA
ncbi:TPA: helix-turn-helix domain-containing protein [Vibrio parahaemolyticus]|uniref:helix-turn-helix domain-containing protein n=1 Tax=Vibrio TaxID=662 RepID=UPI0002376810|nr:MULTISPECIES: AraC family transcriptional regulator [Vibrio]ELB2201662.1 helix-turn-helix domain-containing protein [Vibrio parahaemolyticus]MCS0322468.1 AraC family transcriptional regulator [Vibrio diabolicus]NAW83968.1 helix-turn-helix domain-containing protein [Vibrio sp. V43_P6S15P86]NOH66946.1 helix-turn-helix domain-containing protein [Vibrio rotiferianus]TMX43992.1 AraC family transcriptional regulator [Vibrio rotiferianus]